MRDHARITKKAHGSSPWAFTFIGENKSDNLVDPALRAFDLTHLYACQRLAELLQHGSDLIHSTGDPDITILGVDKAHRADDSSRATEADLGEGGQFIKAYGALLDLEAQDVLGDDHQAAPCD